MAAKHILSLEVLDVANSEILVIKDTSQYSENLGTDCGDLAITPPGWNAPSQIEVKPGFDLSITGCALKLQTTTCNSERTNLQDGVYIIRYGIAPSDKVYVEYNHLRTTAIMKLYYEKLCKLDIDKCSPSSDRDGVLRQMYDIRTLIDAAKSQVEYCGSPVKGMELYNYAKRKLEKINCNIC
tara:strand:+ start:871 stop:1416 length:546 start_codon:yes stop_codon:yes gene_type:complete